jgi:hypothetical protein
MRGEMMILRNSIKMSLRGMKIHEQEYKMKL